MGEWSEYYEDFPEENPANWVGDTFYPQGAERVREQRRKLAADQSTLDSEIGKMIADGKARGQAKRNTPKPGD